MVVLAVIVGLPVVLAASGAGLLVANIKPDELSSMGVETKS